MGKLKIELTVEKEKVKGRTTHSEDITIGELCTAVAQLEIIKISLLSKIAEKNKSMGVRLEK